MSFLKGLIVGIVGMGILFFVLTLRYPTLVQGVTYQPPEERSHIEWGEKVFHEGAYQAIKGRSLPEACGFPDAHEAVVCQEGYFFISYLKKMNEISDRLNEKRLSSKIRLSSISQALGLGMALYSRRQGPDFFVGPGGDGYRSFIEDGWGFYGTFRNFRSIEKSPDECRVLSQKKYCHFGMGRALFFKGWSREDVARISPDVVDGFDFATIFGTKRMLALETASQKVAESLRANREGDALRACVLGKKHFSECK